MTREKEQKIRQKARQGQESRKETDPNKLISMGRGQGIVQQTACESRKTRSAKKRRQPQAL
jgi:hypothetical protein